MKKLLYNSALLMVLCFAFIRMSHAQDIIIQKSGEIVFCQILSADSAKIDLNITRNDKKLQTHINMSDVRFYKTNYRANYIVDSVVYLKNGKKVAGIILEKVPDDHIMMLEGDNKVNVYDFQEIDNVGKQDINPVEYGGVFSIGIALGGGGIVGMPLRINPSDKFSFEAGIYLRPVLISTSERHIYGSYMVAGGPTINFSDVYKPLKGKVIRNGISFKAGYGNTVSSLVIPGQIFSFNWSREAFAIRNQRSSFIMELGAGVSHTGPYTITESFSSPTSSGTVTYHGNTYSPMLYWKFHWCLHTK